MPGLRDVLEKMGIPKEKIPRGFQRIGDIIILNLPRDLGEHYRDVGEAVLREFPGVKTVCVRLGGIEGEFREPSVRVIAGGGTVTEHRENNCVFKLDVSKIMFSKGNVSERGRIPGLVKEGETILDMFAGIGYFSIPIGKSGKAKRIIAIEKNPTAFGFLKENVKLNGIGGIEAVLGDCMDICKGLGRIADRVIMGYLPGTYEFLPSAFSVLKPKGVIHYHDVFKEQDLWDRPLQVLGNQAEKAGLRLDKVLYKGVVKGYAPGIKHAVVDGEFSKA